MRYLKYRNDYLNKVDIKKVDINNEIRSSQMIQEAFENDITWGGSLLGRLINSIIRKGKIYYKTARIGKYIDQFKSEMSDLIIEAAAKEETKKNIEILKIKAILYEIYKISVSNEDVEEKIGSLIGDGTDNNPGLIQYAIEVLNKNTEFPNSKSIIDKLNKLRESLSALDIDASENKGEQEDKKVNENDKFFDVTMELIKSIKGIHDSIIKYTNQTKNEPKLQIGKVYTWKSNTGNETFGVLKSLTKDNNNKPLLKGQAWLTTIDPKTNKVINQFVMDNAASKLTLSDTDPPKNTSTTPTTNQTTNKVESKNDSYFYKNELLPIFEDENLNNDSSKIAWNKLISAYNKSGLSKIYQKLDEVYNKALKGSKDEKELIVKIGKQIVLNRTTIGIEMKADQLIKEMLAEYTSELYLNNIPKAISLMGRVILAFRSNLKLADGASDAGNFIKSFISSFDQMVKLNSEKTKEETKKEPEEEQTKESIFNYSRFSLIREADEDISPETEEDKKPEDKIETENKEEDKVKSEWFKNFKEGEQKNWELSKEEIDKVVKETDEIGQTEVAIDANDVRDHIIRIVNIFGKAYDLYAVSTIPSGRPGGRISLKTFQEYEYIGSGDPKDWEETRNPGYGPWAAKLTFEKWESAIMKELEDSKYKKILQNITFKTKEGQSKGTSGTVEGQTKRTLFNFINEMLGYGEDKKDRDFRSKRQRLMKEYFDMQVGDIKKSLEGGYGNNEPTVNSDDEGEPNKLTWQGFSKDLQRNDFIKESTSHKFIKILYKEDGNDKGMIIFLDKTIKVNDETWLFFKFHLGTKEESMITNYFDGTNFSLDDGLRKDIKYEPNKKIYLGAINLDNYYFVKNNDIHFKYVLIKDYKEDKFEDKRFKIQSIQQLTYINKKKVKEWASIETKPKKILPTDRNLSKDDFKSLIPKFKINEK
jgi:hypothetical protein